MPRVELIYSPGCPNVAAARAQLVKALVEARLALRWTELRTDAPDLPEHARGFGSPTILVGGRDVAGGLPGGAADSCRLYVDDAGGGVPVPSLRSVVAALGLAPAASRPMPRWRRNLALLPGVGFALLPKLACPACWPAYAGLLGTLGLGFLIGTAWLLPLTAVFLAVAVGALAYRAGERRGWRPFALGIAAAGLVLAGKFALDSEAAMAGGLALLVAASLWNTWPVPGPAVAACAACAPRAAPLTHERGANESEVQP